MKIIVSKENSVPTIRFNEIPGLNKSGRKYVTLYSFNRKEYDTIYVSTSRDSMLCFQGQSITCISSDIIAKDSSHMVDVSDMVKIEI